MTSVQIDKSKTFFHSPFLQDYYSGRLASLMSFEPSLNGVAEALEYRINFPEQRRVQLVEVLQAQYLDAGIDISSGPVGDNVRSLYASNAFTITTGQQIHIGLGPLYVYYKILDTLATVEELKKEHEQYDFVPVFWMATEDHDLEEISSIPLFGREFKWETEQSGPVGRMSPAGVAEVFEHIESKVRLDSEMQDFVIRCKSVYSSSKDLSEAFRRLLHSYFGDLGLVIIDGDNEMLKESFKPVIKDEVFGNNHSALLEYTEKLESFGHKRQVVVRECNLFELSEGARTKVKKHGATGAAELAIKDAVVYSPNALLRPLYQEWILPNVVYVGGQAEVKYWMQLKGMFMNYDMKLPVIHNRSSLISIPVKNVKKIKTDNWEVFFRSQDQVISFFDAELKKTQDSLDEKFSEIKKAMDSYSKGVEVSIPGYSINSKMKKTWSKMLSDRDLVNSEFRNLSVQSSPSKKALNLQAKYFNKDQIQERSEHIIGHQSLFQSTEKLKSDFFGFKHVQKIALIFT